MREREKGRGKERVREREKGRGKKREKETVPLSTFLHWWKNLCSSVFLSLSPPAILVYRPPPPTPDLLHSREGQWPSFESELWNRVGVVDRTRESSMVVKQECFYASVLWR